jgi:SAM-dependent methyltransferase
MSHRQETEAADWRAFEHAGWQRAARHYHDWLGDVTGTAIAPLLEAVGVTRGVSLLDVATGPGYAAAAAARRGATVIGVDFSMAMVEEAAARFPGLDVREGDAEDLGFPDGSFDAVTSNFGILHFARPQRALAEAARVLRAGGRFGFTIWDQAQELDPKQIVRRAVERFGDPAVAAALPAGPAPDLLLEPNRCRCLLEAAGFLPPQIEKLPLVQRAPDPDTYVDVVLRGAGPRLRPLVEAQPPEALAAIRATVRDALRACERDGGTELPMPAVLIVAQKP